MQEAERERGREGRREGQTPGKDGCCPHAKKLITSC